ncbi:MAG TPA: MFS transporter [Gaiellaceae bacterium]|nr:MFS transporter [Gaiellaceae bacterium]
MNRALAAFAGLRDALRNENLRRVELAWGAVIAAEWAHFVAFGIYAYDEGGTVAVGIAGVVRMLPAAFVAPFAASLGDRFRRERFLLAISLMGCAALAGSAAAFFAGSVVLVFVLAAVVGLAATLARPALQALLPSLASTPQQLIAANSATSTLEGLGTLVGPLVAGVLVAVMDVGLVFIVGAAAFLGAALLQTRVRVEGLLRLKEATAEGTLGLLLGGFRAVLRRPRPRLLVVLIFAQTLVRGCLNVLIVVAAFRVLDAGAAAVGYMTAAVGLGGFVGALAAVTLERRRLAATFGVALVFWGLPIVLLAPWSALGAALLLMAVVGVANSIEDVAVFTLIQRIVPDEVLTRVLAVVWGLAMGGVAIGSIAAPLLVAAVGPQAAFVAVGAILPLSALVAWRRLLAIDQDVAGPAVELELIDSVPMFEPLPLAAKEQMAGALVPVSVAAHDVVIRIGEPGDRFYIIGEGELEVVADGVRVGAGKGDYFGEIALLRDVPRTATVTALRDSQLYALERDDFLAAVTGHPGAHAAGEAVVDERLGRPEVPDLASRG